MRAVEREIERLLQDITVGRRLIQLWLFNVPMMMVEI